MKQILLTALMLTVAAAAGATNQIQDLLVLDSKIYTISWPEGSPFILEPYIKKHDLKLSGDMSTANYNGHHAIWMVRDKKLYLIGFDSEMPDKAAPGVKDLPGSKDGQLFADWFTGTLTLKYGYMPRSFSAPESRKTIVIKFKNGIQMSSRQPPERK